MTNDRSSPDAGLGALVRVHPPYTLWRTPEAFFYGMLLALTSGVLVVLGVLNSRPLQAIAGVGLVGFAVGVTMLGQAIGPRAWLHEDGFVFRRRGKRRVVRWSQINDLRVSYVDRRQRFWKRPFDVMEIGIEGEPSLRLVTSYSHDARGLMHAIEDGSSHAVGARAIQALDAGQVIALGNLHLRSSGWVILGESIAWRDLERFEANDGVVLACFSSAGLHEMGSYKDLHLARALMDLAFERAALDGGRPAPFEGGIVAARNRFGF
ncbi:MAG: hypothetical protein HS111_06975 [Kofleriaceae bacterium]|nr:hypothetical protein [Kofleriaceae bacterium]MCL4225606.1 hypothetical protein [Myxococcales bacterium]